MNKTTTPPYHITTNATTTLVSGSCSLHQIVVMCSDAGTNWGLRIQSMSGTPNIILAGTTQTVPANGDPYVRFFEEPIPMPDGIEAVTSNSSGSDTGVLDIWITHSKPA